MSNYSVSDVRAIAFAEMDKWGLVAKGWTFTLDNTKSRHGACSPNKKLLKLSRSSLEHNPDSDVVDTIRHEIAHALHFEWCVDNGINYYEREARWTRRGKVSYVRKIPPHGKQWKVFARKVGATDKAASKGYAPANTKNWRAVIIKNGTVEDGGVGCQRFLTRVENRYPSGRRDACGFMYLVNGTDWLNVTEGKRDVNTLNFYQKQHVPAQLGTLSLA